ncbi:hypothetical protein [Nocardioides sp.]|uniref:hypothetical protein n=1 Tax=Nocardioides sp. TaxID=35761 RepID=UPI0039E666D0
MRDALLTRANLDGPELTVEAARQGFANPKLHMILIVRSGTLLGTLVPEDLPPFASGPALPWSSLEGRTVSPDAELEPLRQLMIAAGERRRAVVTDDGHLLGLLCLKRHQRDFCSDADVAARRAERRAAANGQSEPGLSGS